MDINVEGKRGRGNPKKRWLNGMEIESHGSAGQVWLTPNSWENSEEKEKTY